MDANLRTARAPSPAVLDPCLLGRPVHLLPAFATQLRGDLVTALRTSAYRRYWAAYAIGEVTLARADLPESRDRWVTFVTENGRVAFSLQRLLLLDLLSHRYGRHHGMAPPSVEARVTATEERLAVTLGRQLIQVLVARIDANLKAQTAGAEPPSRKVSAAPGVVPDRGCWTVRVVLDRIDGQAQGVLWLALDGAWMNRVFRGLAPLGTRSMVAPPAPLAARLQLTLTGQLLRREMALGDLAALVPGAVIPISIGRADVMLDDTRLFTAAVAEHKGKLCFTSFEDAE